jgi:N-glycosidase YbiA
LRFDDFVNTHPNPSATSFLFSISPIEDAHMPHSTARRVIHFCSTRDEFGCFSNFSQHPIRLKGKLWPTSEHYFQAQKFARSPYEEEIRKAKKPKEAALMGRSRDKPLRRDWESVKDSVMLEAVRAKFTQHEDLEAILLSTGDAIIVERTERDSYWGDGGDGSGKNRLGRILMQVREELRGEHA